MTSDIRVAFRLLWKDKAFTLTAALTLALCIGANTALFSVVHNVLLRPLPVPESDQILLMGNAYPGAGAAIGGSSGVPDYYDRLRDVDGLRRAGAVQRPQSQHRSERHADARPRDAGDAVVLPAAARRAGARPHVHGAGRGARQREEGGAELRAVAVAVRRRPAGDRQGHPPRRPAVHGRRRHAEGLLLSEPGGDAVDAAGVHRGAEGRRAAAQQQLAEHRAARSRARPSSRRSSRSTRSTPPTSIAFLNTRSCSSTRASTRPSTGCRTRWCGTSRPTLYLMWGGALFVLLIGCVNVANLVLVRSRARLKELATRLALGAGRWRVGRQLVTESVLLTLVSAGVGLLVGYAALQAPGHAEHPGAAARRGDPPRRRGRRVHARRSPR